MSECESGCAINQRTDDLYLWVFGAGRGRVRRVVLVDCGWYNEMERANGMIEMDGLGHMDSMSWIL